MKASNGMLFKEQISDETIKSVYKNALKKRGVPVNDFIIDRNTKSDVNYFHILVGGEIEFWVEWPNNLSVVRFIYVNGGTESSVMEIENPDANKVVDSIALEFKKIIKRQSFIKKILAIIF